jgi:hypothetical protein
MTSTAQTMPATDAPSRTPLLAALGYGASAVLTAAGTFWDLTDNESGSGHSADEYLIVLGTSAVMLAIVFGLVVRAAERGNAGRRSAVLGVVGFLSNAVFWAGFPAVIAAGSLACALTQKDRDRSFSAGSKAGLALSGLTVAAAVMLAIVG